MPSSRGGLGAAALGDLVFAIGGETSSDVFGNNEAYNAALNTWVRLPSMPTPRHGLAVAAVGGRIYTIGGGPDAGFAQTDVVEVFTPQ